ncbi:membrane protein YczE [Mycetocola reblochoni]|uniref:Membrane protein n=2 Tax=Mycetocola reblochoni TaxID=331618 RepID=A0A1R4IDE4_9MICO|nr:hypothetical protein [Mycetocola reblochoni]RLP69100.1 hypothetical protein D9V30_07210 [Mycetocola reblochoni]SJN17779.1 membrane protein [Mycetocola reblochoni REB411]
MSSQRTPEPPLPGPLGQLREGRLPRRLTQLLVGLVLYGVTMAMLIRSGLGLDPWDVLHEGLAIRLPLSFGQVVIATGVLVLLAWIPLRQSPGVGTIANVVVIGLAADAGLALIPEPNGLVAQIALLVGGIVGNGLAGALYIGARLGTGPRDGLWVGLARRTGLSTRLIRTVLELTVLVTGWLLGGTVGVGTVLYAIAIGPVVQLFARRVVVLPRSAPAAVEPLGTGTGTV